MRTWPHHQPRPRWRMAGAVGAAPQCLGSALLAGWLAVAPRQAGKTLPQAGVVTYRAAPPTCVPHAGSCPGNWGPPPASSSNQRRSSTTPLRRAEEREMPPGSAVVIPAPKEGANWNDLRCQPNSPVCGCVGNTCCALLGSAPPRAAQGVVKGCRSARVTCPPSPA